MKKVQIITMTITFWLESSSSRMSQESGFIGRYSVLCTIHSVRLPISWNDTYDSFTFDVTLIWCKQTCSWESLIRRTRSEQWIIRPICCVLMWQIDNMRKNLWDQLGEARGWVKSTPEKARCVAAVSAVCCAASLDGGTNVQMFFSLQFFYAQCLFWERTAINMGLQPELLIVKP